MERPIRSHPHIMSQKPLLLYTARAPNGTKASILLEELKAAYGDDLYDNQAISCSKNEQKEDWFIKINPDGISLLCFADVLPM